MRVALAKADRAAEPMLSLVTEASPSLAARVADRRLRANANRIANDLADLRAQLDPA